jgi:hypothetical protein
MQAVTTNPTPSDPPTTGSSTTGPDQDWVAENWKNEAALAKSYHETIREITKGKATQRLQLAELVQKGAAGVAALYSGLLGVAFVAGAPLPFRAVVPVLFLGAAVSFAMFYASFLTRPSPTPAPAATSMLPREGMLAQTDSFVAWAAAEAMERVVYIRCAVVALALGLVFLPAPFVGPTPLAKLPNTPALWPSPAGPGLQPTWPPGQTQAQQDLVFEAQLDEIGRARAAQATELDAALKRAQADLAISESREASQAFDVLTFALALSLAILALSFVALVRYREKTGAYAGT